MFARLPLLCLGFLVACGGVTYAEEAPNFSREILPLLSDACFHCHGPDANGRKADLRLDTKEGAFRTADGVTVVAPGDLEKSELILRILSDDPDEQMPPPKAARQITAAEKELLKRWVKAGAPWGQHWAFEPMSRPEPPAVKEAARVQTPIDRFVEAKLEGAGLTLAPEASRERLLRRVSLDLTGLPPTPQERAAFLADGSPQAYERVVDRLLASPRFGERLATEWMDVARYADTHGYQMDRPRAMWPWRDWVVSAFNRNLPWDEFTRWQLAGDLLPNATQEQRLATGFQRLHCQNEEGGIVEEEYRVAYVADRVNTFGTAFLAMTFECARCHDHKYDPISQRDVYQLFSFFQNIDEAGQISYKGFADSMPVPTLQLTTPAQEAELAKLREATRGAEAELARVRGGAEADFATWLAKRGAAPAVLPGRVAAFAFDTLEANGTTPNLQNTAQPGKRVEEPKLLPTPLGQTVQLSGEDGFVFPGVGHFKRTEPFSISLWIKPPAPNDRAVVLHHSKAPVDAGSRGYELLLEQGKPAFGLHYLWPGASLKVVSKTALPAKEWSHVLVTYDGSSRAAGVQVYRNGARMELETVRDGLYKDITYTGGEPDLALGHRFRDSGFKGGEVDLLQLFTRELTPLEAQQLAGKDALAATWKTPTAALTAEQREGLRAYFLANVHASTRQAVAALQALREKQNALLQPVPEVMVMQELPQPKPAHILERGAYDALGAPVAMETPHILPPLDPKLPRNRLGLAEWLLHPEHPLMARVTVNRFWQMMFGRGLVETSDNFGIQGAMPTHPELLDWLARDFIAQRWDVKRFFRQVALSAVYRQETRPSALAVERDPQNLLFSRAPARRLTAEMLRDQALATSGLLVEKVGGPSVKPYQPAGLWEEIAMGKPKYEQGTGADLHRRSLYTFWKRTVPPPVMVTFDAAERNVCVAKRQSTSTPLQALALLNDVQQVEAARFLAQRMMREGGASAWDQLRWGFALVTGRAAATMEVAVLERMLGEQRALFASDADAVRKLMAFGESKSEAALAPVELAARTVVAQAMLNLDEALMLR